MKSIVVEPKLKSKDFGEALDEWMKEKDNVIVAFDENRNLWLLSYIKAGEINFVNVTSGKEFLDFISIRNEFMMQAVDTFEAILYFDSIDKYKAWLFNSQPVEYSVIMDESFIKVKDAQKQWSRSTKKVIGGMKDGKIGTLKLNRNGKYCFMDNEATVFHSGGIFKEVIDEMDESYLFESLDEYFEAVKEGEEDEQG